MKKIVSKLLLTGITLTLCACLQNATAMRGAEMANKDLAESGSPYRVKSRDTGAGGVVITRELIGTPASTVADSLLKSDILKQITIAEQQLESDATPDLLETRQVSIAANQVIEVWVVKRGEKQIPYLVDLKPSPQGGVDMNISGPWAAIPAR